MEIFITKKNAVNPDNVAFIKGESNYTTLFFSDGSKKMVVAQTLHLVHEKLSDSRTFIRLSKSVVLNVINIETFNKRSVKLKNGESLVPSRRRARSFFEELHKLNIA